MIFCKNGEVCTWLGKYFEYGYYWIIGKCPWAMCPRAAGKYCRNDWCYIPPAQAGYRMVEQILLRYWSWTPSSVSGPRSPRSATLRSHLDRISFVSHTLRPFCFNREENEGKESKSSTWSELEPVFVSSEWNSSYYLTPPARETWCQFSSLLLESWAPLSVQPSLWILSLTFKKIKQNI